MGRKPRQHYRGAFYHFIARGNNRQPIFSNAHDRQAFERYLSEGVERFGNRCHAYCWMTNHVHMVVEVADVPLSHIAHNLLFRYARWFHRKYGRSGHLFERRYRAFLVENDDVLRSLVRYIHLNPVRAEIVESPRTYSWSSYSAYVDPGSRSPSWLTRSFVLSLFAEDASGARAEFRAFTETLNGGCTKGGSPPPTVGTEPEIALGDALAVSGEEQGAPRQRPVLSAVTLDQILHSVSSACSLQPSELLADVQKRTIVNARSLASFLVRKHPVLTLEELGAAVARDASTLSRAANNIGRRLAHDPDLRTLLEQIEDHLDHLDRD